MPFPFSPKNRSGTSSGDELSQILADGAVLDDEDRNHVRKFRLLSVKTSVYDSGFISLMVRGQKKNADGTMSWHKCPRRFLGSTVMLVVTIMLQFMILLKVQFLESAFRHRMDYHLWSACHLVEDLISGNGTRLPLPEGLGTAVKDPAKYGSTFHCAPLIVTLFSNPRYLDFDGDGYWTQEEASAADKIWPTNMVRAFDRTRRKLGNSSASAIPVAHLEVLNKRLALCRTADPSICGNLEARDVLEARLPGRSPDDRIEACERLVSDGGDCPDLFGQEYKIYEARTKEFCGEPISIWFESKRIQTVVYKESERYNNAEHGLQRRNFAMFMSVIVMIWMMLVMAEVRDVCNWWVVLLSTHWSQPGSHEAVFEEFGQILQIRSLPKCLWWYQMILSLFPRTVVCGALAWVGTKFLLHTDNYMDLILNSVALGFLVEIDDMMFVAVESRDVKQIMSEVSQIQVKSQNNCLTRLFDKMRATFPMAFIHVMMIVVATTAFMLHTYMRYHGIVQTAHALECLCMMAGESCVGAHILGGMIRITDHSFASERSFYVV